MTFSGFGSTGHKPPIRSHGFDLGRDLSWAQVDLRQFIFFKFELLFRTRIAQKVTYVDYIFTQINWDISHPSSQIACGLTWAPEMIRHKLLLQADGAPRM